MPKLTKEISSGHVYSRSSQDGAVSTSQTRVFRILLSAAGEVFDPQAVCGIQIGDPHPVNPDIYCVSFDGKFEGDSRMVALVTFNYESTPGGGGQQDPKELPPDIRPSNVTTSTSLMEIPAHQWREVGLGNFPWKAPLNPAGDKYEGVTRLEPVVSISVEQFEENPFANVSYAGMINSSAFKILNNDFPRHSLMFRGIAMRPMVEFYRGVLYRGWMATYELAYRRNDAGSTFGPVYWNRLQPQTGFNVLARLAGANIELAGNPLKHNDLKQIAGWPNAVSLPTNVAVGQKSRGMVLVAEYENGGASQMPCPQPIPLNDDGSPRSSDAVPQVLVDEYQVYEEFDFANLGLRFGNQF